MKDVVNYLRPDDKAVIFCSNKARACDLSAELHIDLRCETLYVNNPKEQAITDFTSGGVRLLIATGVTLRELDIGDITYVC